MPQVPGPFLAFLRPSVSLGQRFLRRRRRGRDLNGGGGGLRGQQQQPCLRDRQGDPSSSASLPKLLLGLKSRETHISPRCVVNKHKKTDMVTRQIFPGLIRRLESHFNPVRADNFHRYSLERRPLLPGPCDKDSCATEERKEEEKPLKDHPLTVSPEGKCQNRRAFPMHNQSH